MTYSSAENSNNTTIAIWLALVALLVFAMVIVGGATRLTDSGLSITEWKPLLGAIPPLSTADWLEAFEKYKQIPEYSQVNKGMSLDEFKFIFWWEWGHRFLGRIVGLVFALPFAYFWLMGRLHGWLKIRLIGLFLLGGLQGLVGWYMVMSGLVERVDVSHYRLALHLTIAFLIFAGLIWTILDILDRRTTRQRPRPLALPLALVIAGLLVLQVVLGAFVAGTKAGLTYTTWPLMDGALVPDGLWSMDPWWLNISENLMAIQFNHRILAYLLFGLAALQLVLTYGSALFVRAVHVFAGITIQIALGIWTLLAVDGSIPIGLGIAHQAWAAVVLGFAVWHLHGTIAASNPAQA